MDYVFMNFFVSVLVHQSYSNIS